jgi:hypothetical protein
MAATNTDIQAVVWAPALSSFEHGPRTVFGTSYSKSLFVYLFIFLRNHHSVSHSSCTMLHTHQQCRGCNFSINTHTFGRTGIRTRGFVLVLCPLSHSSKPFCFKLLFFKIGFPMFAWGYPGLQSTLL